MMESFRIALPQCKTKVSLEQKIPNNFYPEYGFCLVSDIPHISGRRWR